MDLHPQLELGAGSGLGDEARVVVLVAVDELLAPVARVEDVETDASTEALLELERLLDGRDSLWEADLELVLAVSGTRGEQVEFQIPGTLGQHWDEGRTQTDQNDTDNKPTHS